MSAQLPTAGFPSWETVQEGIDAGVPTGWPAGPLPGAIVRVGPGGGPLALLLPASSDVQEQAVGLESIVVSTVWLDGNPYVQVAASRPDIAHYFHGFASTLVDELSRPGAGFSEALGVAVQRWSDLLKHVSLLSDEAQIGLWGELWLTERLLAARGVEAIAMWTGPSSDVHDFRLPRGDIEVKTTTSEERIHWISSLDQLVPAVGRRLFLLSLQLKPAPAAGLSLPDRVARIRKGIATDDGTLAAFNAALTAAGYDDEKAGLYSKRFIQRSEAILIDVAASTDLPVLSRDLLLSSLGASVQRLVDVRYRIAVSGLGHTEGDAAFEAIIGGGNG